MTQRVYRLALISDPTYAEFFGTANVLAEKVTLMNRVNQLYNDDAAIKMILVNGTDKLNIDTIEKATGPDGPCGAHSCYTLDPDAAGYVEGQLSYCDLGTLQRNQNVLGQLIGAANYDLGHIALGTDGGGVAGLGVVGSVEKPCGCTGIPAPGDKLTYLWEQNDIGGDGGTALVDNRKRNGPLFRVFGFYADVSDEDASQSPAPRENIAGTSPARTFPDMTQIRKGNTNAKSGRCPAAPPNDPDEYVVVPFPIVNCYSEFLPVKGYVGTAGSKTPAMHFRLTARDSVPGEAASATAT